jgi:hypothetical protein
VGGYSHAPAFIKNKQDIKHIITRKDGGYSLSKWQKRACRNIDRGSIDLKTIAETKQRKFHVLLTV